MRGAHYELVEAIGEGGMGRVYRAVHHPSGAAVAIKTLHSSVKSDPLHRRLLLDEATAAAKIDDPHIVRILDLGRDRDDAPFLVMELAHGVSLDAVLARWPGWDLVSRCLLDVLRGLTSAHAAGIVHRDLKPGNVIVDPAVGRARILDFGVAALLDPLQSSEAPVIVGTPEFMPPEQLVGRGPIGPWTDLYAFGVMLAQAVRGRSPFAECDNLSSLLLGKAKYFPMPEIPVREGLWVPRAMQDLIEKLIRPHPRARPRFAIEVARELEAIAGEVRDQVPRSADALSFERPESTQPTTVDPLGERAEKKQEVSVALELPAFLPAAPDLALGAHLARLREIRLVGRAPERAELEAVIAEVVSTGSPQLIAYVGEPGIGKSRLARFGLAHVERAGVMEGAAGGYDPSGADIGGGLRNALRRLVGLPTKGWNDSWSWLADQPGLDLEKLVRFLRADDSDDPLAVEAVVQLALATLRAVGRMRAVYLWLDDLAWARDGALDVVERVLFEGDFPVLVIATMRSGTAQHAEVKERLDRILGHPRARTRELGPLAQPDRASLLEAIAPLAPGLASTLAARIEGSPLLLLQLVQDWLARGMLEGKDGTYRPRGDASVDDLLVERPLAGLLEDRLEEFLRAFGTRRPEAEAVLGRAALLGARFEHSALRAACGRDAKLASALDDVLDRALLVGIVRSERSRVYAFDHGLVHEALVDRIERGPGRVKALIDAANGLQARYGKERADVGALVADLLHRAGDRDRAWERLLRSIEKAAWAGDDGVALSYLAMAQRWALADPARTAEVEHQSARVHYFALRYESALDAVLRARSLAVRAGNAILAMACDSTEADVLFYQDRFAQAQAIAERCAAAGSTEDPEQIDIRARAAQRLAELAVLRGELMDALKWREEAAACAEASGKSWRVRVAQLNMAEILAVLGRTDEALAICDRVLEDARSERDEDNVLAVRDTIAHVRVMTGAGAEWRTFLDARRDALVLGKDAWRLSGTLPYCALLSAELDESEAAVERAVRECIDAFRAVPNDEAYTIAALRALAARLEDRGKFELAHEVDGLVERRMETYRAGFERATDPDLM